MQQIKTILSKQLDAVLPATNQMTNLYFESCLKASDDQTGYARCMMKKMEYLSQKEDQLAQKFQFLKMKFEKCKKSNIKHSECVQLVRSIGARSIDQYIYDIQKY